MLGPRRLLPLVAALVTLVSAATNSSTSSSSSSTSTTLTLDGWYTCSAVSFESQLPETDPTDPEDSNTSIQTAADCAIFKAPLCHTGVCEDETNTQIDVFVKRISSGSSSFLSSSKPNIFFMQGGPGAASPAMESAMTWIFSLLSGNVNVYTMDHRGTGRSTKLDCVAAQAQTSGSPSGTSIDSSEVADCAAEIEAKYGSDLSSFSVTSAASDLKLFISTQLKGQKNFVYGVSYGSSLVERLIHLNTTDIAGYILDGISTTSGSDKKNFEYFSTWDTDYDEVGNYFLSYCEKNQDDCGKYFKDTNVITALKTLISNLDSSSYKCSNPLDTMLAKLFAYPVGEYSPATVLRQVMGTLLADATTRKFIPVLTYRLTRCNTDDISVLNHFFNTLGDSLSGASESDQYMSDLLYRVIVYSEFWESPAPSFSTLSARFLNTTISSGTASEAETYCVFSKDTSSACTEFASVANYKASPLVYKKDKYWNVAAKPPSDVSVLLMSSKMDPQTPHKYAEYLFEALDTDNKELITFEQATHATLWSTPTSEYSDGATCGMKIVASYLSGGGKLSLMDKSCVATMPLVSFAIEDELLTDYLNSTAPYDGTYTGSAAEAAGATDGGASSSTSGSSSGTSYKGVFIVFLVLFVLATVAAVVFVVKWRKAKQSSGKDIQAYEATTETP